MLRVLLDVEVNAQGTESVEEGGDGSVAGSRDGLLDAVVGNDALEGLLTALAGERVVAEVEATLVRVAEEVGRAGCNLDVIRGDLCERA